MRIHALDLNIAYSDSGSQQSEKSLRDVIVRFCLSIKVLMRFSFRYCYVIFCHFSFYTIKDDAVAKMIYAPDGRHTNFHGLEVRNSHPCI